MVKRGDWIEVRDAPNTRGIVQIVHETRATILLSGDYDLTTIKLTELQDHWEPMQFDGVVPFWLMPKMVFTKRAPLKHDEDYYAEIVEAQPGWVAYYAKYAIRSRAPCFFMAKWWEFRKEYEPVKPPSAWDHLLNSDDD